MPRMPPAAAAARVGPAVHPKPKPANDAAIVKPAGNPVTTAIRCCSPVSCRPSNRACGGSAKSSCDGAYGASSFICLLRALNQKEEPDSAGTKLGSSGDPPVAPPHRRPELLVRHARLRSFFPIVQPDVNGETQREKGDHCRKGWCPIMMIDMERQCHAATNPHQGGPAVSRQRQSNKSLSVHGAPMSIQVTHRNTPAYTRGHKLT